MGKSSSSSKRKRLKHSSQVRTKKRSKTKRHKSKKLRRHDDSVSYSSDDSRSSVSVSSNSEDSYRHGRSQSRTHKDVKVARKRGRSHSSSNEESNRLRRHKRSRRDHNSETRKKTYRNKKKKAREASISSRSSGSRSCSTCRHSSSDESDNESRRGRLGRREGNTRKLKNAKSGITRRRYRSRSCSSCSGHDESSDHWSKEIVIDGTNSKRLKSVVTLAKEDKKERESDWDVYKEEMICDHDDYPSSRSNDSNDGGNKRMSAYKPCIESEERWLLENEKKEDASASNMKTYELPSGNKDEDDHPAEKKPASNGVGTNDAVEEKNSRISEAADNVNANDLESVLRKKALENLRRFRGGTQTNVKSSVNQEDEDNGTLNSLSAKKAEVKQIVSLKECGTRGDKGDSSCSVQKENVIDSKNGNDESVSVKNNAHIRNQMAIDVREKVNMNLTTALNKPRLVSSALKQALSNAMTNTMESSASQELSKAELITGNSVGENNAIPLKGNGRNEKSNNASASDSDSASPCLSSTGIDVGMNKQDEGKRGSQLEQKAVSASTPLGSTGNYTSVNQTSGSASGEPSSQLTSAARDASSGKSQDDDKEGSQLEQKTMSVMRGGEMVQVSYKVYIPKRAPALARRQLKR